MIEPKDIIIFEPNKEVFFKASIICTYKVIKETNFKQTIEIYWKSFNLITRLSNYQPVIKDDMRAYIATKLNEKNL